MDSSPGFGSTTCNFPRHKVGGRPIQTRFPCGSGPSTLTSLQTITRWLILQKARRHPLRFSQRRTAIGLRLIVSTRFQGLFHSPHWGSFHLSLTVLVHYRSLTVFSLTPWSGQIHTEFHGLRVTWELVPASLFLFAYGTVTLYGVTFQKTSTKKEIGNLPTSQQFGPNQPHNSHGTQVCRPLGPTGLGSSRFARRYSGNRVRFLLLRLLRCFNSPAYLLTPYRFRSGSPPMTVEGLPHSGIPGSEAPCAYPRLFVAWYALHRLLVPRHPPCALSSLITQK